MTATTKAKPLPAGLLKVPQPPPHLAEPGRTLWLSLVSEYGVVDSGGLALVQVAAEAADRAAEADAAIRRDGLVLKGRDGQAKTNPAAQVQRDAHHTILSALRGLNLDLEPVKPMGRPPGR